ncbi:MAG: hypothetical protein RJA63_914 [Pseudomonadota bacterium]|jgi:superfamily II DNA/RNA helicase
MTFESLQLHPSILSALQKSGYTTPTPVQAQSIPLALTGVDLMVSAATGSGKTAAFMLPALQRLTEPSALSKSIGPRILVLCPTRELAQQVGKAAITYGRGFKRLSVVTVVGGMPYPAQLKLLRQPVDVLVATPGRLLDYIDRGRIDFTRCEMLVLDEADRMLDMGFKDDIDQIVAALPAHRQTVMFSATFGGAVGQLAHSMLTDPTRVELAHQSDQHADISQHMHWADDSSHKLRLLDHLLRGEDVQQAIVFAATKRDADWLSETLGEKGFSTAALHGDMPQGKRNRTLTDLRREHIKVLVATDVAARGIDVPNISHVINFGMPMKPEDYVHRIGRTGRAGRTGIAITLAMPAERFKVKAIERFTTHLIPAKTIEGLEPRFKPEQRDTRSRGGRPPREGARPGGSDRPRFDSERPRFGDRPRFGADSPRFADGHRSADRAPASRDRAAPPPRDRESGAARKPGGYGAPRTFSRSRPGE